MNGNNQIHKAFKVSLRGTRAFHIIVLLLVGLAAFLGILLVSLSDHLEYESLYAGMMLQSKAPGAELSLLSPKTSYRAGEIFDVTVLLSSLRQETVGVDVQLQYDPEFLQLEVADSSAAAANRYLIKDNAIFDQFPGLNANTKQGLITFSSLKENNGTVTEGGIVAGLRFRALKQGETEIKFVAKRKSTTDTNVNTKKGKDILVAVNNLQLTLE
jgi:hypothetical protein